MKTELTQIPVLLWAEIGEERLSNQHPGETFEILQCLAVTRTVMAKTFWLDGLVIPLQNAEIERVTK